MLVGEGFSPTDAGEVWHLFDTRFNIPLTLIPVDVFNRSSITRYNTIIIPPTVGVNSNFRKWQGKIKAMGTKRRCSDWIGKCFELAKYGWPRQI